MARREQVLVFGAIIVVEMHHHRARQERPRRRGQEARQVRMPRIEADPHAGRPDGVERL